MSRNASVATFRLPADGVNLEDVERQWLTQALERAGGNQTHAAASSESIAIRCDTGSRNSGWRGRTSSAREPARRRAIYTPDRRLASCR